MTRVFIELEFEANEVSEADVYNYLNELMENDCLDWNISEPQRKRSIGEIMSLKYKMEAKKN